MKAAHFSKGETVVWKNILEEDERRYLRLVMEVVDEEGPFLVRDTHPAPRSDSPGKRYHPQLLTLQSSTGKVYRKIACGYWLEHAPAGVTVADMDTAVATAQSRTLHPLNRVV